MNAYGLTGNIGCGKSTVASLLATYPSVRVYECDAIAKKVFASASLREALTHILGVGAFPGSEPDWDFVRRIFFNEPDVKSSVEALVHPRVWAEVARRIDSAPDTLLNVVESALIYESESAHLFHGVIVATCDEAVQFNRLMSKRNMSSETIRERLRHQLPLAEKVRRARYVIDTTCTIVALEERTRALYEKLITDKGVRA